MYIYTCMNCMYTMHVLFMYRLVKRSLICMKIFEMEVDYQCSLSYSQERNWYGEWERDTLDLNGHTYVYVVHYHMCILLSLSGTDFSGGCGLIASREREDESTQAPKCSECS